MIVSFDLSALIPAPVFNSITTADAQRVLWDLASAARAKWIKLASQDKQPGSHWRFDYIQGIQPVTEEQGGVGVALVGEVPHMLEDGFPAIDLRKILLGPNVPVAPPGQKGKRMSKSGGYYRAIPFRHMSPGTRSDPRGRTFGQEIGVAYKGHAQVGNWKNLQKQVYGAAKKLGPTISNPYAGTQWGERLQTGPGTEAGNVPKLKGHHSTNIYQGMVRQEKNYEKATQSQYTTFRTISTEVGVGEKWMRRQIPARHYAEQVKAFIDKIAPAAASKYARAKGL